LVAAAVGEQTVKPTKGDPMNSQVDGDEIDDGKLESVSGGSFFGTDGDGNLLDKNGLPIPRSGKGTA
jgi:hypothetical protein